MRIIMTVWILIFALVVATTLAGLFFWKTHLKENGQQTTATVVDISSQKNDDDTYDYIVYFSFYIGEKEYTRQKVYNRTEFDILGYKLNDCTVLFYDKNIDPFLMYTYIEGEEEAKSHTTNYTLVMLSIVAFILFRLFYGGITKKRKAKC